MSDYHSLFFIRKTSKTTAKTGRINGRDASVGMAVLGGSGFGLYLASSLLISTDTDRKLLNDSL